jgi:cytochrome c oxidase assembly protein subunit 15
MLIILAAVVLCWRATHEPETEDEAGSEVVAGKVAGTARVLTDRTVVFALRGLAAFGALTIVAGTAATAAGPHAGGSPGQKINRLDFDGRGTMDFVIHRHAEIAFVFSLAAVAIWWLARKREVGEQVQRPLTILCVLLAVQGAVGLDQYETHLPTELVWVHVGLACAAWISVLWAAFAAGPLASRSTENAPDRALEGSLRSTAPLEFPGN